MIILRDKHFTNNFIAPNRQQVLLDRNGTPIQYTNPKDANVMTALGKTGLTGAGLLAGVGTVEGAKSVHHIVKAKKAGADLINLVGKSNSNFLKNPGTREGISQVLGGEIPTKLMEGGVKAYGNLKKSKISKAQFLWNSWNNLANLPRLALLNMGDASKHGVDLVKRKSSKILTKEAHAALDKIPIVVENLGRSGISLKNARGLFKGASALAGLGGIMYINGRSLQSPQITKTYSQPVLKDKIYSSKEAVKEAIDKSYKPIYFHENGETSRIYRTSGVTEESLKEVSDSIAKHKAKAKALRAKKLAGKKIS